MGRDSHDRAGPVFHQDEICHIYRNPVVVEWIDAVAAGENPFLFRLFIGFLPLFFYYDTLDELGHLFFLAGSFTQFVCERMLRRNGHECCAEYGVRAGGEYL